MKQNVLELLKNGRLYFDGGTGTALQDMGLSVGTPPEEWSLLYPERVRALHEEYLASGANIIKTNTFGVNSAKYENYDEYINASVKIAKAAVGKREDAFVAFDIGPLGKMLAPLGTLDFEDAVEIFAKSVRTADALGVDLILIETMTDSYETKAAVLAARENSNLPVFVTNVYDESSKLMTGASPEAMVAMLEGLGVSALGANCSLGPDKLMPTVKRLLAAASIPVIANPNAGLPTVKDGRDVFDISAEDFAGLMSEMAALGVSVLGGCCGTTPEYIRLLVRDTKNLPYEMPSLKNTTLVSSYTHALELGKMPVLIGERINPTGKPKLKEALRSGDVSYILGEAVGESERGAHALDLNVGLPGIDEAEMMKRLVYEVQSVTDLPLQIDSGNTEALEGAMRIYNGKPFVNSVNGKAESLSAVLPLVKKYGGVLIALTMDEEGIPETVEGRVAIAEKILSAAGEYGISRKDIVFDPLCMAVSSDKNAGEVTLGAIRALAARGLRTSLGVSNISFGLPNRELINSAFFALALDAGLDAAIMNPYSEQMMSAYLAFCECSGDKKTFAEYTRLAIEKAAAEVRETLKNGTRATEKAVGVENLGRRSLAWAVINGLRREASMLAEDALGTRDALSLINEEIIPALTKVGEDFEAGRAYLPSLLMSAEAAVGAFDVLKAKMPKDKSSAKGKIVLATVKGDIHDIGKNIVKVLLESHGYEIIDLGRDVAPEIVLEAARKNSAGVVGLSALMTTTLPAMEETIRLLRSSLEGVKIMVGGAVLTEEYAQKIGADFYAKDAMAAVRCAECAFGR